VIPAFFTTEESARIAQAFLDALDGVAYLVDIDGTIVAMGQPGWDEAAGSNAAGGLTAGTVLGANLFDRIKGDEVRAACNRMHAEVTRGDRAYIAFEYRCDAPDVKRRMRMSVTRLRLPGCAPVLLYQSQTLSAVARPWVSLFEPQRIVETIRDEAGLPIVRMCSFCQRVASPAPPVEAPVTWIEAEDYYRQGGPVDVRISHGVCPGCSALGTDGPVPAPRSASLQVAD